MNVISQELLPASLATLLSDEQRQAIAEAPREKRLEALASALSRPEPEVLEKLAAAANLDIATNLETDPDARGLLPARLVHEYQIILIRYSQSDGQEPRPRAVEDESAACTPNHSTSRPRGCPTKRWWTGSGRSRRVR